MRTDGRTGGQTFMKFAYSNIANAPKKLYILPTPYVFCTYLKTNSEFCFVYHKRILLYNRDEKCLLRGMNWAFK